MLMLNPTQISRVRDGYVEYNVTWTEPVTRAVKCRCCGEKISKGESAIRFWWDFTGHGPHFITKCSIHVEPCERKEAAVKRGRS